MKKPRIYLAGGMEKAGTYGAVWRREITPHLEELGYEVWNPDKEEMRVGITVPELKGLKKTNYPLFLDYARKIVDYDIACLVDCTAVAARVDQSVRDGAGTYGELTISRLYNIPVYAWIDLPNGKFDVPSWAMGCLTKYYFDKDSFYNSIPAAMPRRRSGWEKTIDEYVKHWEEHFCDH